MNRDSVVSTTPGKKPAVTPMTVPRTTAKIVAPSPTRSEVRAP
ncbi:MAG: hypothetical protein QM779_08055 [Propionicimonas sp.]